MIEIVSSVIRDVFIFGKKFVILIPGKNYCFFLILTKIGWPQQQHLGGLFNKGKLFVIQLSWF